MVEPDLAPTMHRREERGRGESGTIAMAIVKLTMLVLVGITEPSTSNVTHVVTLNITLRADHS